MTVAPGPGQQATRSHARTTPRFRIERGDAVRDKAEVVALLQRNRPAPESREARYVHYYERCPAGPPVFWVARETTSGQIVGMFAVLPAPARVNGALVGAGVEADFVVDVEHRGAFGPAVPLVRALNRGLEGLDLAFVHGFPNSSSERVVSKLSCEPVGKPDLYGKPLRLDLTLALLGRLPRVVRPFARVLDPVLRIVGRDDRHRFRRSGGYRFETPPVFDARFEAVWRETRETYGIVGERTVELLNWKYGLEPARGDASFTVLALVDRDDVVAAYAVVNEDDRRLLVADMAGRPSKRELDLLLGHLIAFARGRRVAGIGFRYFGPDTLLIRRLRSFGFVRRPADGSLLVRVCGSLPGDVDLTNRDTWYFTGGDTDI